VLPATASWALGCGAVRGDLCWVAGVAGAVRTRVGGGSTACDGCPPATLRRSLHHHTRAGWCAPASACRTWTRSYPAGNRSRRRHARGSRRIYPDVVAALSQLCVPAAKRAATAAAPVSETSSTSEPAAARGASRWPPRIHAPKLPRLDVPEVLLRPVVPSRQPESLTSSNSSPATCSPPNYRPGIRPDPARNVCHLSAPSTPHAAAPTAPGPTPRWRIGDHRRCP